MQTNDFIMMPVPVASFAAVCALLGGASTSAIAASIPAGNGKPAGASGSEPSTSSTPSPTTAPADAPVAGAASGGDGAGDASGEVDAEGWPWTAELHAGTKTKTKAGLWRMKVGATRPDPKPGFAKVGGDDISTDATASGGAPTPTPTPTPAPAVEEDDEFAAFRAAAADKPAEAKARTYTDADLGALCNQAATKLGDPAPIKAIIAEFMPEGTVPHSRNVPADKRADFVKAVEAKAGIEFAG